MSASNPSALFTLVSAVALTAANEEYGVYDAGNTTHDRFDEIRLVDGTGEPCAIVADESWESLDARAELTGGGVADTPVCLRHNIVLAVDYITAAVRQKLMLWMKRRRQVYFTPGFGRFTHLAWRPTYDTTPPDLTGRHTLAWTYDLDMSNYWDDIICHGMMRQASPDYALIKTPFGTGQVFEPAYTNYATKATPTGSSDGDSGWVAGGAGAGTLTKSYDSTGFGPTGLAGAVRVVGTSSSSARDLRMTWGAGTPTGAGTAYACVFLRGRLGAGATLTLDTGAGESASVNLYDKDLSEWTPIFIVLTGTFYSSAVGGGTTSLKVNPIGSGGNADTCDFMIGPTSLVFRATASGPPPGYPQWKAAAAKTRDGIDCSSFTYPTIGSLMVSFYVPSWYDASSTTRPFGCDLIKHGTTAPGRLFVIRVAGVALPTVVWSHSATYAVSSTATFTPGAVNTIAVVWDQAGKYLYINGALADSEVSASQQADTLQNATAIKFFGTDDYGSWPLIPLTLRIDNEVFSANEIADLHAALSTPVAIGPAVNARGRLYRIRSIPSVPRICGNGTTHYVGALALEQVSYDSGLRDLISAEGY